MPDRDAFVVRTYRPGDETAILEMWSSIFGHSRTLAEWEWRFRKAPWGPAEIVLLETEGAVVGHIAHVGFETLVEGRKVVVGHGGDTMVHPDMRDRGGLRLLVETFLGLEHNFDVRMGFPTDKASAMFGKYGGGRLLGHLERCVRWRRPISLVRLHGDRALRPQTLVRDAGAWLRAKLSRVPKGYRVEVLDQLGKEVDALVHRCAQQVPCMRLRDAAYITWRWLEAPETNWTLFAARDSNGFLQGLVVCGIDNRYRKYRFPAGHIVDMLAVDAPTTRTLLSVAAQALFQRGCTHVVYEHHDPRPWSRAAHLAAGFMSEGRGHNFVCRSLSDKAGPVVEDLGNWYLTIGDTDLA